MTDQEAQETLKRLEEHFGEPVMPVGRYCAALSTWADVASKVYFVSPQAVREVRSAIYKSCLLARLIYGGEELRTEKCPIHNGRWSGIDFDDRCPHHCGYTGWVPNKKKETVL